MGITLGLVSIKGGVGKTTLSASLATNLANNLKKRVLLVDTNFSAPNLGLHMDIIEPKKTIHEILEKKSRLSSGIHQKYGVDVVPGSYNYLKKINYFKLKDKIKKLKNDYDFIILDSSPSYNEEILSTIIASDRLFIVTTPDYPTLSCSLKTANLAKQRGRPVSGIIINKIRDPLYELTLREIEKYSEIPVVARIPDEKKAIRSTFTRIPLTIYDKNCKFSREINALSKALSMEKEKRSFFEYLFPFNFKKEEINRQLLKKTFYNPMFQK